MKNIKNFFGPRPTTRKNYLGKETKIMWPKGTEIARSLDVHLFRQSGNLFAVVYGLEVKEGLAVNEAFEKFGWACYHQAKCEGLIPW